MRSRAQNVRAVAVAAILSILVLLVGAVINGPADEVGAQGASADYFLKIEGIEGESLAEGHVGEIELESWSWGETNSSTLFGAGAGTGKVNVQDFSIVKKVDKATPKLMLYCALGTAVPSATLTGETNGVQFLKIELKNVLISSFQVSADRTTGPPTNVAKLRFSKIIFTYYVQTADGTTTPVRAGYDVAKAKSI